MGDQTMQLEPLSDAWSIRRGDGPVLATAVHAGHFLRPELRPFLAADDATLRREEDPMTGHWAAVGDASFCCYNSRFEVDLNRPRHRALSADPNDTWGLRIWREAPPADVLERSLRQHDAFYALARGWLEELIAAHGTVLVLDIHAYNHRRGGPDEDPAPADQNPDIDLGCTTLDPQRFGSIAERFQAVLADQTCGGRGLDVRTNVRYPDGGHWPEWVFANFGDHVCTITLEYKKIYMDELNGTVCLSAVDELHEGLRRATHAARQELARCR